MYEPLSENNKKPNTTWVLWLLPLVIVVLATLSWYQFSEPTTDYKQNNMGADIQEIGTITGFDGAESIQKSNKVESVDILVDGLRTRLGVQSDDVDGWVLLAKSYHHLQRSEEAEQAYNKAKSLGYSGASPLADDSPQTLQNIEISQLNKLEAYVALDPLGLKNRNRVLKETEDATADDASKQEIGGISVRVSLGSAAQAQLSSDSSVFVFARSNEGGPPLAVSKLLVGELPASIVLSDNMAMIPGSSISGADIVVVGARASKSGNAARTIGDFEVLTDPLNPKTTQSVVLVIDQQVTEVQPAADRD